MSFTAADEKELNVNAEPFFPLSFHGSDVPSSSDYDRFVPVTPRPRPLSMNISEANYGRSDRKNGAALPFPAPAPPCPPGNVQESWVKSLFENNLNGTRGILTGVHLETSSNPTQRRFWRPKTTDPIPLSQFVTLKISTGGDLREEAIAPAHLSAEREIGSRQKEHQKHDEKQLPAGVPRGNTLDSSAPLLHKGKQRENPKKKFTKMKKVILNERKQCREIDGSENAPSTSQTNGKDEREGEEVEYRPDTLSVVPEAVAGKALTGKAKEEAAVTKRKQNIPSMSRFCDNVLSKELDERVTDLVRELGRFQDRLYAKDPEKARLKKRLVYGLREVHKLLKVEKIKCVIFASNIEAASGEGGPDEIVQDILHACQQQNVPYIFALTKSKLGVVTHKHRPVSCAGILNYQGANEFFKAMHDLALKAKEEFIATSPQQSMALSPSSGTGSLTFMASLCITTTIALSSFAWTK